MASVVGEGSAPPKEKFSYTSKTEHFHLVICPFVDLKKAPKLSQYPPNTKFLLTAYYCDKLNSFNVMALNDEEDDMFRLNEQILDIVEETDLRLERTPLLHEVLLAPKKNQYCRAVVLKLVDDVQAEVYFFDVGGIAKVGIDKLKPVNIPITKFPILGHHVISKSTYSFCARILMDYFQKTMEAISKKEITIEYVDNTPGPLKYQKIRDLVSQRTVNIFYQSEGKKTSLRETIDGMRKWEWEKYSNLKGDDDDICKNGRFGTALRMANNVVVSYVEMEPGTMFTALVSRIQKKESETDLAELNIILLDESTHMNFFYVLHDQLQRYAEHIKKSNFFPALDETLMFKLHSGEKYNKDQVKWPGKWVRAVRVATDMLYLMDFDDYVPFTHLPEKDYDMRRLYGEFSTIPSLTIHTRPFENGKQLTVKEANEKLPALNRYKFKIIDISDNGRTYDVSFGQASAPFQ